MGFFNFFCRFFLFLPIFCVSCQPSNQSKSSFFEKNGKIKVLSTIAMIHDIVKDVGGDFVDPLCLIEGELDPHSYELSKGDLVKFERADFIFCNGLGLEHGLSLRKQLENNQKVYALGDMIIKEQPSFALRNKGQLDPHIWLDISLWSRIVDPIVQALSSKCPEQASYFHQRGEQVKATLLQLDKEAYLKLQSIPSNRRYLVSAHNAFDYFTRHYLAEPSEKDSNEWHERAKSPEGLAPEAQIALSDMKAIFDHIEKHQIRVLFRESNVNCDCLKKIAACSHKEGLDVRVTAKALYADAMGKEGSYYEMLRYDVDLIYEELMKDVP